MKEERQLKFQSVIILMRVLSKIIMAVLMDGYEDDDFWLIKLRTEPSTMRTIAFMMIITEMKMMLMMMTMMMMTSRLR